MPSYQLIKFFNNFIGSLYAAVWDRVADEEHHMLEPLLCRVDLRDEELDDEDLDNFDYFDHSSDLCGWAINARYDAARDRIRGQNSLACVQSAYSHAPISSHNARYSMANSQFTRSSGKVRLYTPERYPQYLWHYYTPIRQRHRSSLFGNYCHIVPYYQWPRAQELRCPKRRKFEARIMRKSPIDRAILQPIAEINISAEMNNTVENTEIGDFSNFIGAKATDSYAVTGTPTIARRIPRRRHNYVGKWCIGNS
ncbi:uncharacterized protein V1513DRAFT_433856 [Lipomyces chichibuensis]|uniref:uncharacterized protein n=1 Tax=Lipomyces chichibuensis TaxID=1546026 RepID=UPI00334414FA